MKGGSSDYNDALTKSKELQGLREDLLNEYNTFPKTNIERLKKMLPDHVDNVRLIIEIDNIASQYGMTVKDAQILSDREQSNSNNLSIFEVRTENKKTMSLSFTVVAPYESFLRFLRDLEQNLRIVDIESISFSASDVDLYEYDVTIKTYWLAPVN